MVTFTKFVSKEMNSATCAPHIKFSFLHKAKINLIQFQFNLKRNYKGIENRHLNPAQTALYRSIGPWLYDMYLCHYLYLEQHVGFLYIKYTLENNHTY